MALTQRELDCLDAFRSRVAPPTNANSGGELEAWSSFTVRLLLEAARLLRRERLRFDRSSALKADGSPTIQIEQDVEAQLRTMVTRFAPEATLVGE